MLKILLFTLSLLVNCGVWASELSDAVSLSFELSELKFKSIESELEIDGSISLGVDYKRHKYSIELDYNYDKDNDPYDHSEVIDRDVVVKQIYEYRHFIIKNFSYVNHFNYERERKNSIYSKRYDIDLGPVGIKYLFYANQKIIKELSISFTPIYNILNYQDPEYDWISGKNMIYKRISRGIEYTSDIYIELGFWQNKIKISNEFLWKKNSAVRGDEDDDKDDEFKNTFKLSYTLNNYTQLNYTMEIETDQARKEQGEPLTSRTNTLSISFYWN